VYLFSHIRRLQRNDRETLLSLELL